MAKKTPVTRAAAKSAARQARQAAAGFDNKSRLFGRAGSTDTARQAAASAADWRRAATDYDRIASSL